MAQAQVKYLNDQYDSLMDQAQNVNDFMSTCIVANYSQAEAHMFQLEKLETQFEDVKSKILLHNASTTDPAEQFKIPKDFFKRFYDTTIITRGKFFKLRDDHITSKSPKVAGSNTTSHQLQSQVSSNTSSKLKMAKIQIPKFNGDLSKWLGFIELFEKLVDQSSDYNKMEKFQYLSTVLEGEPQKIVQRYALSEANYDLALKALKDRYQSNRLLVAHLVNSIVNYKAEKFNMQTYLSEHESVVYQLQKLNLKNLFEDFYFQICYANLPNFMRQKVDEHFNSNEIPGLQDFFSYLLSLTKSFEMRNDIQVKNDRSKFFKTESKPHVMVTQGYSGKASKCPVCNGPHYIYNCKKFLEMSVDERFDFTKGNNICFNCLRIREKNHNPCSFKKNCKTCNRPHNTLLHRDNFKPENDSRKENDSCKGEAKDPNLTVKNSDSGDKIPHKTMLTQSMVTQSHSSVILGTIQAFTKIQSNGQARQVVCLVDNCSEISLITQKTVDDLGLKVNYEDQEIHGVNGIKSESLGTVSFVLFAKRSMSNCFSIEVEAQVVKEISSPVPSEDVPYSEYAPVMQYHLADRFFYKQKVVNILLSVDVYCDILAIPHDNRALIPGRPTLQYSHFGYIVMGKMLQGGNNGPKKSFFTRKSNVTEDIREIMQNEPKTRSVEQMQEDLIVEDYYSKTHSRLDDGTYVVSLPFISDLRPGKNKNNAFQRYLGLERKLERNPELAQHHHDQFNDYLNLNHMSIAKDPGSYYIPYHYVIKPDSSTTQFRAVFDASSKDRGLSLNDCLYKGPNLYNDLSSILMRFQLGGPYTLTADLSKCYRRIKINPEDAKYQYCFYRDQGPICELRLECVVFGVKSSPFLAIRTLHQLVKDEGSAFPTASEVILKNFYMDDCVVAKNSVEELQTVIKELEGILAKGNFPIHKFSSNAKEVLDIIDDQKKEVIRSFKCNTQGIKVLGLKYNTGTDEFLFVIDKGFQAVPTKRTILSYVAQLFDPQGFIEPVIFWAKRYINKLWCQKLDWDTPLEGELLTEWTQFANKLESLNELRIPRYIPVDKAIKLILLGACDASFQGIAANVYVQCILDNNVKTQLLKAKSRVKPKKIQVQESESIPTLELNAAVLLSNLVQSVRDELNVKFDDVILFSDSLVVLSWIKTKADDVFEDVEEKMKGKSKKRSQEVINKINEIRNLTKGYFWVHLPGVDNPADLATRGLTAPQFLKLNEKWFHGPQSFNQPIALVEECRSPRIVTMGPVILHLKNKTKKDSANVSNKLLKKYFGDTYNYIKIIREHAWIIRFVRHARKKGSKHEKLISFKNTAPLSVDDLNASIRSIARMSQAMYFESEIATLKKKDIIRSSLSTLNPQLDAEGTLVVGGRLAYSNLPPEAKHPIIISNQCKFAEIIIDHFHVKYFHAGPSLTLALTRQKFWITQAKNLIKARIKDCNRCRRFNGPKGVQVMADLPKERVTPSRPFTFTGCDVGGPILIKTSKLRKAPQQKAYFIIFVCFATKACHIEALTELTTECFLATFGRFTARRGLVKCLFSDCGTNFVGAKGHIKEVIKFFMDNSDVIFSSLASLGIEWRLNPPHSPHMGGIWERQVRSIKEHLYKQTNPAVLTYEEFSTLLCFIESLLNSRPLQPLDTDVDNIYCLTPAHFLIGGSLHAVPAHPLDLERSLKSRWMMVQQKSQAMWQKWYTEYLHNLQQRFKWKNSQEEFKVGQVVLMTDINTSPLNYPMGRIIEVLPSKDNHVRVVKVKTSSKVYVRPIAKLIPLATELN